ncbi:DUF3761 domain-containing protein [Acetobacter musti]|uniref:DUF3761 domain-containing protein n=1 Tax=Acetobacter musti TaxID=864732 RepID=A0ABX0JWE0_9PROT|nr:DUF3761 domain-containing protein [Acetobacter musti]
MGSFITRGTTWSPKNESSSGPTHGRKVVADRSSIRDRRLSVGMRQTDCEGSYSFSLHRRRTCSHHVGAAKWL